MFCGCAKLSSHIARLGQTCLVWDINLGADYDLTARKQQLLIRGWISAGLVSGVHLGAPCNSFSRARDSGPGPPRLRSDSHPLGLPSLWRLGDIQAVNSGNRLMRFSAQVLRACLNARVPATLENPRLSRLWLCPPIASISRLRAFSFHIVDFCMFGTAWKKPTGILSFSILTLLLPFVVWVCLDASVNVLAVVVISCEGATLQVLFILSLPKAILTSFADSLPVRMITSGCNKLQIRLVVLFKLAAGARVCNGVLRW